MAVLVAMVNWGDERCDSFKTSLICCRFASVIVAARERRSPLSGRDGRPRQAACFSKAFFGDDIRLEAST